jgi:hypothetical protein
MGTLVLLKKFSRVIGLTLFPIALASACSPPVKQFFSPMAYFGGPTPPVLSDSDNSTDNTPAIPNPSNTVCDPFGGANSPNPAEVGHGLVAQLKYLSDDMTRYTQLSNYSSFALSVNAYFYFFQLNVPTRLFTQGFQNQNGTALRKPDGEILFEYFFLHFKSQLFMPQGEPNKKYQFALLSDDGSILSVDTGNGLSQLINNDGQHASRFQCAMSPVTLSSSASVPIQVDYYQGPRQHIALMLMFREWADDTISGLSFDPNDPLCGVEGNDSYFDYNTIPSTPKQNYNNLLARGWKVVPSEYYYLPGNPPPANPCQ